ncbi:MAG: hypothetical protein K9N09_04090 [Candidatus Cloacimonetes bacterium]|nr:hypothetical protein [Candidatus Cloacimonadota bacterium]MCF7815187.1 hypothetical protein [Candidatus Cloacimonadota bacterium]MCF7867859.1 hypothetical protein [Candidatus Cloacimonadota bacterium]MCF7884287.1 hypothetical protein [Candidatus Cloacimonadota bacterium]
MKNKLIKCRNCGKMVGSKAKRCKHCGTMLRMPIAGSIIIIVIVLFIVAMFLIGYLESG